MTTKLFLKIIEHYTQFHWIARSTRNLLKVREIQNTSN